MMLELEQQDLISMVKGISPPYSVFDHDLVRRCGSYMGGFVERWAWDSNKLNELTKSQLWELYQVCKRGNTI